MGTPSKINIAKKKMYALFKAETNALKQSISSILTGGFAVIADDSSSLGSLIGFENLYLNIGAKHSNSFVLDLGW